jgi:anti-sigma factor RsiW
MRCDEIQEQLIDLLYDEGGASPENSELQDHLRGCPACRREYEELQQTRKHLRIWKDESPPRSVSIPRSEFLLSRRSNRNYLRYAAIAAMVLICFLIFADAEITLNRTGFSYHSHLFTRPAAEQEYYTKAEARDLLKRALDESELRANEVSYMMARKIMDTVERERWMEMRPEPTNAARNRN